jgi:hypothetical protein
VADQASQTLATHNELGATGRPRGSDQFASIASISDRGLAGQPFGLGRQFFLIDQDCHEVAELSDLIANAVGRRPENQRVEPLPLIVTAAKFDAVDRQVDKGAK